MRRFALILFALFACLGAAACGQKGPLKLPQEPPKALASAPVPTFNLALASTRTSVATP